MKKFIAVFLLLTFLSGFDIARYQFFKLDDTPLTYEELVRKNEKTILFVWTSRCHFCRDALKKFNKECPAFLKGEKMYYIDVGENKDTVTRLMQVLKIKDCIKNDTLLDRQGFLVRKFRIVGVPTFLFIKKGKLVYKSWYLNQNLLDRVFGDE